MTKRNYPQDKIQNIADLESLIKQAKSIYLADFTGLDVGKMTELRNKFFDNKLEFRVVKNTLAKIALHNTGIKDFDPYLNGPNALAFGYDNPAIPAKIMFDFAQENEKLQIKSCIFEGRFFAPENIKIIKDLPPREQIIAELVGQIQSPLSGFVGVLNETIRGFLCLLDAIIQQKGVITETVSN